MPEIFGIIGDPVEHSLSPVMHNAVFKKLGLDYVYLSFRVKKGEVKKAIEGAKALGFKGLNVTIPHKEDAFKHVVPMDDARYIEAVNTIHFSEKGVLGYNTDGAGAVKAMEMHDVRIKGTRFLLAGAGGAAKAVGYAIAKAGGIVIVTNRTASRGAELASYLRNFGDAIFYPVEKISELKGKIDVIINATPVGMDGKGIPVPKSLIERDIVVFDMVYSPKVTPLLKIAREEGCRIVHGIDMLVHQGAEALKIWLGISPPIDEMYRAIEDEIGKW